MFFSSLRIIGKKSTVTLLSIPLQSKKVGKVRKCKERLGKENRSWAGRNVVEINELYEKIYFRGKQLRIVYR